MGRVAIAALFGCAVAGQAAAQPAEAPRKLLDAPQFTIRPQAALAAFPGQGVDVVVGWRPVAEATRYRVTFTNANNEASDQETKDLRVERKALAPGRYQLTVAAIDASGTEGAISEPLPISVIEVHAVPPGTARSHAPSRGAYPVGTRFSVPGMHCTTRTASMEDLLVEPENELRIAVAGLVTLRCGGMPGYLEKPIVIAPVSVALRTPEITRGAASDVFVTLASVAQLGDKLEVTAAGDLAVGEIRRTSFGLQVQVTPTRDARRAALRIHSGDFELGRVELSLVDPAVRTVETGPAPAQPFDWRALDLGGHGGAFVPPTGASASTVIGRPTDPRDAVTGGPLVGLRLGVFPTRRVGLEGEISLIAGGYADDSGVAHMLAGRGQLAVRAFDRGRFGIRFLGGAGTITALRDRLTSKPGTESAVHAGAAFTVETSPDLWLRFQIADVVTTARDDGYAHCLELQLGVVTRVGRRDAW